MMDSSGQAIFATPENEDFYRRRKYLDLNPHIHQIRLLCLHPVRLTASELSSAFPEWIQDGTDAAELVRSDSVNEPDKDFICCQLIEPLQLEYVSKKYAALSYCAGSASKTKRIMIDGFWFNAFANLEHALDMLINSYDGDSESSHWIWTDQACINQAGHLEKTHQVGFMRQIYENAERTYVVLSTPSSPTHGVRPGVRAVRRTSRFFDDWMKAFPPSQAYEEYEEKQCSTFFTQLIYENPDHPICDVLPQLFEFLDLVAEAKWWTRAWVFQEFIVSAQVVFVYGKHHLSLQDLEPLLLFQHWNAIHPETWQQHKILYISPQKSNRIKKIENILKDSACRRRQSTTTYTLPYTFCTRKFNASRFNIDREIFFTLITTDQSLGFQATDQRDMIYAFIGLTHCFSDMVPDYSSSNTVSRVFLEAAEKVLQYDECFGRDSLLLLRRAAGTRWRSEQASELPSWCPDWTSPGLWPHDSRRPYIFPSSKQHYFTYDLRRSKWKILRVQGVYLTQVGNIDDQGTFTTNLGLRFETLPNVVTGDELWILNRALDIYVLRKGKGDGGGYILVGLALLLPRRARAISCYMSSKPDFGSSPLEERNIIMEIKRTKGLKWVEIL